jgi:hypothetical protein
MKNLKHNLAAILIGISSFSALAQGSTGALKGQILNTEHEPVFGATIKILQGGSLIGGTSTDVDGMYTYKPLDAGSYDVLVSSAETQSKKVTDVRVSAERTTYLDLSVFTNTLIEVEVIAYRKPLVDKTFMDIKEISGDDLIHSAYDRSDLGSVIVNMTSEATRDENGDFHVRGGRGDATAFIIDGVKSPNISGVPSLAVENMAIITGGIPAQYGDNTSGVIIITSKDYFSMMQSQRMRHNYILENKNRVRREKQSIQNQKLRKKEIDEELKLEQEAQEKKWKRQS